MDLLKSIAFLVVALFISAAVADVEVLNDVDDNRAEDFLEMEQLIPADAIAEQNVKNAQRNLASVKQTSDKPKGVNTDLKVPVAATNTQKSASQDSKNSKNTNSVDVKHMTSHDANQRGVPAKSGSPQSAAKMASKPDDDVNLADEGFLLEKSRNGRKLTEFLEPDSNSRYRDYIHVMAQDDSEDNSSQKPFKSLPSSSTTSSETTGTSQQSGKHKVEGKVAESRHKPSQRIKDMRKEQDSRESYLAGGDMEDFDMEHDGWAALNVACRDDESSWECLMFKEDYIAMRHDANLSNRVANGDHKRVKRQSVDTTQNGTLGVTVSIDTGIGADTTDDTQDMGSGIDLVYNETETVYPTITLKTELEFELDDDNKNKTTLTEEEKEAIRIDLENKLREVYKNMTGFTNVTVDPNSIRIVNGSIKVNYSVTIDTGDPGFRGETPDYVNQTIVDFLNNISSTFNLTLNGTNPLGQFPIDDFLNQLNNILNDPCVQDPDNFPCSDGYDQCTVIQNLELECTHRCVLFQILHPCEHSSTCDLDMEFEPYCACTKNWEGEYCEIRVEATDLDGGEITGIVIGGVLTVAGIIGCCCWFLLCLRNSSDMVWTAYTDEEGTGGTSDVPNFNWVIDRPHCSENPLMVFTDPTTQEPLFQVTF